MLLLPNGFHLLVIVEQRTRRSELRLIVVTIAFNVTNLQLEACAGPKAERVHRLFIRKLRVHCLIQLVENLLAELKQLDLAIVLRIELVLDDVDIANITKLTLLSASLLTTRRIVITGLIPETAIHFANRVILTNCSQGVFNVPLSGRALEAMAKDANERNILFTGSGKETNHSITIASLVDVRVPEAIITAAFTLRIHLGQFTGQLLERALAGHAAKLRKVYHVYISVCLGRILRIVYKRSGHRCHGIVPYQQSWRRVLSQPVSHPDTLYISPFSDTVNNLSR